MNVVRYLCVAAGMLAAISGVAVTGAQQPPDATRTFTTPADYAVVDPARVTSSELRDMVDRFNLTNEVVGSKAMTLKAFNDAFLSEGQMAIEMMRAVLTRQPLMRDYSARWKFYGVPRGQGD